MPPEEEIKPEAQVESEAEPEPEPSPTDDTGGESEPEREPEDRQQFRRVRDDLYRRQSKLEQSVNQLLGMVQGIAATKPAIPEARTVDPTVDRIRLQQDPRGLLNETFDAKAREIETRLVERTRQEQEVLMAKAELDREFPELNDPGHPFFQRADKVYRELVVDGLPENARTVLRAAKLAQREAPELREEKIKSKRREVAQTTARRTVATEARRETEAPPPKKTDTLPELTREDHAIARTWGLDLTSEKDVTWLRKERARLDKLRITPSRPKDDTED